MYRCMKFSKHFHKKNILRKHMDCNKGDTTVLDFKLTVALGTFTNSEAINMCTKLSKNCLKIFIKTYFDEY